MYLCIFVHHFTMMCDVWVVVWQPFVKWIYDDDDDDVDEYYFLNYADEKYHEQIHIESDSCGHCYEEIFGRFLDASVTEAHVEDSYIRSTHQACVSCIMYGIAYVSYDHMVQHLKWSSFLNVWKFACSAIAEWSKWIWLVNCKKFIV